MSLSARAALPVLLLSLLILPACAQEKKVVYSDSFLSNVAGAESKYPSKRQHRENQAAGGKGDPRATVVENPDGTKTLYARTPKQLMNHIMLTVRDNDPDTFVSQVLSRETRERYSANSQDPRRAHAEVKARYDDMLNLFKAMPMGEMTPGVFLQSAPGGVKRMMAEQRIARDLNWKGIDMAFERGNYKLVWFVE